jgi:hypothetical protein
MKTAEYFTITIDHRQLVNLRQKIDVVAGSISSATKKAMSYYHTSNPRALSKTEMRGMFVCGIDLQGRIVL